MKFLEWNNCLASHFFNSPNAGKDTYLYITKNDVINYGKEYSTGASRDEIWIDFLLKVKSGLPGSKDYPNIIDKAVHSYRQWTITGIKAIEGIEIEFPPYIIYLIFFILPLTEIKGNYNANNYYDRLNDFLHQNGINQNLKNKLKELEPLWVDLVSWTNEANSGELGFFRLSKFIHLNWKYVGKLFSQCVMPPKIIKKLPELFLEAGMAPNSFYEEKEFVGYLSQYGESVLGLSQNAISLIQKSAIDELGKSIIEIVKREYNKWTGESYHLIKVGSTERIKLNYTTSSFRLQFKMNENAGKIYFSYRMFSTNEYPEDLKFAETEISAERGGFSRTLPFHFVEFFEFVDSANKWKATFPNREVRIFISAGSFLLSTDYWIETDVLSRTDWMFILCKSNLTKTISEWAKGNCSQFIDQSDLENIPIGFSLIKILNPRESHTGIPLLTVFKIKTILLTHGLKVNFRTFLLDDLLTVEIKNADGGEKVYLQYKRNEEKIFLKKKQEQNNRWLLPSDILLNMDFHIKVEDEIFPGNELTYTIITADNSAIKLNDLNLPKRDTFGKIITNEATHYALGSNVIGTELQRQLPYTQFFTSINIDTPVNEYRPAYTSIAGNALLSFLTLKTISTTEDFYEAFEFFHSAYFGNNIKGNLNYPRIKKSSINLYDYLGFADYDYETKQIVVNPPQLILIPSERGRKTLLIGGRDSALVQQIIEEAPRYALQVEIKKQLQSNENLLLPEAITIKAFGKKEESYGLTNLISLAKKIRIRFNPGDFVQIGIQLFSADIGKYQADIIANNETDQNDYGWIRSIFNADTLHYEKNDLITMNTDFSLIEYKFNEYTFLYKLWLQGKCYSVDRNWGKYLALKHYNKEVIFYGNEKVAIPIELPLPRLLAESIMLLSGIAPEYSIIDSRAYRIYENIPGVFAHNLFLKLGQKPIQKNL